MRVRNAWRPFRTFILLVVLTGVVAAVLRLLLFPAKEKKLSFSFPERVPLPGWQACDARTAGADPDSTVVIAQGSYLYSRKKQLLDVKVVYLADSDGNVRGSLPNGISEAAVITIRENPKGCFFVLWTSDSQMFLSAFMNPQGSSTVTEAQFRNLRLRHDVSFARVRRWLLGLGALRDNRCMLVHMTLPVAEGSSELTAFALEEAWASWSGWWLKRFPEA